MYLFEFGENKIFYNLQRTRRRHSIGISVMPNHQVVLRVPKCFAQREIDRVLEKRVDWILKKQKNYRAFQGRYTVQQFITGETIPYLGEEILIKIDKSFSFDDPPLLQNKKLTVFVPNYCEEREFAQKKILKWYQLEAAKEIEKSIDYFAPLLQVHPKKITIRNQKHLWGSCTQRHHLSFNWRLILLPPIYLDYVVAHELCHILHLNHSKKFWDQLESILPDSLERRRWLKEYSMEYLSFQN